MRELNTAHHCKGLSLVELLVAMVLGLSLAAGVSQVYVGNNQTQRDLEAHMRMQENGRFAIHFLSREIRMAGYLGCSSGLDAENVINALKGPPSSFQPEKGIQGWESSHGAGTAPGDIFNSVNDRPLENTSLGNWTTTGGNQLDDMDAMPGSDLVRIWGTSSGSSADITDIPGQGADTVVESEITSIADGDILILSDCERAELVQACGVSIVSGRMRSTLSQGCTPGNNVPQGSSINTGGELVKLKGTMFYVSKRGGDATNPPALFRRELDSQAGMGTPEELVEGIESIQILYGLNVDNDSQQSVDAWVPADQVADWGEVISARISVLVQSIEDNLAPASQSYRFNGVLYDGATGNGALPEDRGYRRVFTSTITLRNRAVGR